MVKPLPHPDKPSSHGSRQEPSKSIDEDESGLTDDRRVSRAGESSSSGARVKPGPAHEKLTDKTSG